MSWRFEQPAWLWAILITLPLALVGWWWMVALAPPRRTVALLARAVLVALLASILAGLSRVRSSDDLAVVVVADVSQSVRELGGTRTPEGDVPAMDRLQALVARLSQKRGPDDLLGVVAFDGRALGIAAPTRGDLSRRALDVRADDGTNIEQALRLAASLVPPGAAGRLLLVSDGNQTRGDARLSAEALAGFRRVGAARAGLPVDVAPIRYQVRREVSVESVEAPPTALEGAPLTLRVTIDASAPARGVLTLTREGQVVPIGIDDAGRPVAGRRLELGPGVHVETIQVPPGRARVQRFRATFVPDEGVEPCDTLESNNEGEAFTITPGRGAVLLVDGVSGGSERGAGSTLALALEDARMDVRVVASAEIPGDMLTLQGYDLVVLENVPAEDVPAEVQERLVAYVRDLGGGLVMVGGPNSFAPGGWRDTPLEPILPVRLDVPSQLVSPEVATVFVIDVSGSMNWRAGGSDRTKIDIANEATATAIRRLEPSDLVGVVTFNNTPQLEVPLGPNDRRDRTAERVRAIGANGGTNMPPALELAREQLRQTSVKLKHVIVLSDGRSQGRERLRVLAASLGEEGVKVSTIAVGGDADIDVMEAMADQGRGEFYNVLNPSMLPRIFLKAIRAVRSPQLKLGTIQPLKLPTGSPALAGLERLAPLSGIVVTFPRPEETITNALATASGEPILSHWSVGLGQVGAFTSDAHDWSSSWLEDGTYAPFWSQLSRTLSRPSLGEGIEGRGEVREGRVEYVVSAPRGEIPLDATVYYPSGRTEGLRLEQVAPGEFRGSAPAGEPGAAVAIGRARAADGTSVPPLVLGTIVPRGEELRARASNESILEELALRTGGRVLELDALDAARAFDRAGLSPQEAASLLWRTLCVWAIVMLLLDIAARRVAWDRWLERGPRVVAPAGAGAALEALRERDAARSPGVIEANLSDVDQAELLRAARDRRRAMKLGEQGPGPSEGRSQAQGGDEPREDGAEGSGLLAAKKRARARFEEGR